MKRSSAVAQRLRCHPLALGAALLLSTILITTLFAPLIAPHDPLTQDIPHRLQAPGTRFFFGTDTFGRDLFTRIIYGARGSLYVAFAAPALGALVGLTIGLLSGYVGGLPDLLIQRLVDALLGFPPLLLGLVVVVAFGPSTNSVMFAIALALAPQTARLVRARVLNLKQELHVAAARTIGASPSRILAKHILPHALSPVLAQTTGYVGAALIAEASLSFLGFGVPPPDPSWGRMLAEGSRQFLEAAPWLTIFPGLAMAATMLSATVLGDSLRDFLDPRLRDA